MNYTFPDAQPVWPSEYIWHPIERSIDRRSWSDARAFELGCGNGFHAELLSRRGFDVWGVDPSESGIEQAKKAYPALKLQVGDTEVDLAAKFGTFPLVYSIEVIEHVFDPKLFAKRFYDLLEPGGMGILSTPYHGWLKNVAISVSGKWDAHHNTWLVGGHIKFFSIAAIRELLQETGFKNISIKRVGRFPLLAKSMLVTFTK